MGLKIIYDCSLQRSLREWGKNGNIYVTLKQEMEYHAHEIESVAACAHTTKTTAVFFTCIYNNCNLGSEGNPSINLPMLIASK